MNNIVDLLSNAELGPYLVVVHNPKNIISVFDELHYDRADADLLSPAMRMHLVKKLAILGFKQKSGRTLEHSETHIKCHIPSSHALGASPFHITDSCPIGVHDYYVLTPTQTACQFIRSCHIEQALANIKNLIQSQPININRLSDYLEYEEEFKDYLQIVGHLKYLQRVALESSKLKKLRPLSLHRH